MLSGCGSESGIFPFVYFKFSVNFASFCCLPFQPGRICRRKVKNLLKFVRSPFVLWLFGFAPDIKPFTLMLLEIIAVQVECATKC